MERNPRARDQPTQAGEEPSRQGRCQELAVVERLRHQLGEKQRRRVAGSGAEYTGERGLVSRGGGLAEMVRL